MPHNHILLLDYYTQVTKDKDIVEEFFVRFSLKAKTATTKQKKKSNQQ